MIKLLSTEIYSARHYLLMRSLFCLSLALTHLIYGQFFLDRIATKTYLYQSLLPDNYEFWAWVAYGVFLTSMLFAALNIKTKYFLVLGLLSYLAYIKAPMDWLRWHDQNIPFWALLLFTLESENHNLSWSSTVEKISTFVPGLTYLSLSLMFMATGINKLIESGWSWVDGRSLQYILVEYHLFKNAELGLWLVPHIGLLSVASLMLLIFQLVFPISFVFKKLRPFFLISIVVFFAVVYITTEINFYKYFWMIFLLFIPYDYGLRRSLRKSFEPIS